MIALLGFIRPVRLITTAIALFLLMVAAPLFAQSPARAKPPAKDDVPPVKIVINLDGPAGDFPSHLCVITVAAPTAAKTVSSGKKIPLDAIDEQIRGATGDRPKTKEFSGADAAGCVSEAGACAPSFEVPEEKKPDGALLEHYVLCAKNQRVTRAGEGLRVVVAHLREIRFANDQLELLSIMEKPRLDGNVATLSVRPGTKNTGAIHLVGAIVGGHYAVSGYQSLATESRGAAEARDSLPIVNGLLRLPLTLRCDEHEVELPPAVITSAATVTLSEGSTKLGECKASVDASRRFKMSLPYLPGTALKTLRVQTGDAKEHTLAKYGRTWVEPRPPPVVALQHLAVSLSWERDCLYPFNESDGLTCPNATILGAGLECTGKPRASAPDDPDQRPKVCSYICDSTAVDAAPHRAKGERRSIHFSLPARVRFQRPGSDEVWEEELSYGNQILSGYVASSDRHVDVDLSLWGSAEEIGAITSRPAARLEWIAVRGPTGTEHFVAPKALQRLGVPGVRCGDVLSYRMLGDREYTDGYITVNHGKLSFPRPEEREQIFFSGLGFGGGGAVPMTPIAYESQGIYIVPVEPFVTVRGIVGLRPPGAEYSGELRLSVMVGPHSYFPITDSAITLTEREWEQVAYARYALDLALWWTPNASFYVGIGPGLMVGSPFTRKHLVRVGAPQPSFSPALVARYRVSRQVSFEATLRVSLHENVYVFNTDFKRSPQVQTFPTHPFLFDLTLRTGP